MLRVVVVVVVVDEERPLKWIVQTAQSQMPHSCKGTYRRVAVLEVDGDQDRVAMISTRARGVVRIIARWEKLNVGGARSAYGRALAEAERIVADHESLRRAPARACHDDCRLSGELMEACQAWQSARPCP